MLMTGALVAGLISVVLGIVLFTTIPRHLGVWRFVQNNLWTEGIGWAPSFHHGIPWGYTWEEFHQQDLTGKTALVTGANSGIGFDLSFSLAQVGASVILACRDPQKCSNAKSKILSEANPKGTISTMTIDTASFASTRAMAQAYAHEYYGKQQPHTTIDLLFLNAGVMRLTDWNRDCPSKTDEDQIEVHFQVNYLSHYLLYRLLEPFLSEDARIIPTSSGSSFQSFSYTVATDLETLHRCDNGHFNLGGANLAYGQSKVALILWVKKLARMLGPDSTRRVNAFHPGLVNTPIVEKILASGNLPAFAANVFRERMSSTAWQSPDGALTGLYLACVPAEKGIRGRYFHPMAQEVVNPASLDEKLQDDLWAFSQDLVKDYLAPIEIPVAEEEEEEPTTSTTEMENGVDTAETTGTDDDNGETGEDEQEVDEEQS
ncbi:daunorubicin C-13 ketoreductase DnrU [Seminavis robusta]|uniref:Daunorubicin C-13 ketoreductase DnrU n=1 Tax=Seminavis robusta TaxID=568900 RepID=A0A9N8DHQ3_9STRA|nr:daunorubicin C-13 ketoreductase DnrU [Seminavis robusta]|eukprot:Sro164_g073510.1 daunorubicin C-13 ketoreductase DnrU (431) ;mRNA; f:18287-19690